MDHVLDDGLAGYEDSHILDWASERGAIVIACDEDFADVRMTAGHPHAGVVRLRIWPTTTEATLSALHRLLDNVPEHQIGGALVIVDNHKIRVRAASCQASQ